MKKNPFKSAYKSVCNYVSNLYKNLFDPCKNEDTSYIVDDTAPFDVVEAYSKLSTNIIYLPGTKKCKTIVVTSATEGEGKTLLAVNLAARLAQIVGESKVLLVDSDFRKSGVSEFFDNISDDAMGLSEYLAGANEAPRIVTTGASENLFVLPAGKSAKNPASLLSSSRLAGIISKFEDQYDYVIIDTPPVDFVTDALFYAPLVTGYIVSVRANRSKVAPVNEAIDTIKGVNGNVIGVVLNSAKQKKKKYSKYNV